MSAPRAAWCAAQSDAVAHVLLPAVDADELVVDGPDGHHLARVRRLRVGEVVTAADGAGTWRACEVAAVEGATVRLRATGAVATEPALAPPLAVAFVPAKGDQPESVVASLTELGVDRILPVLGERSVVRWTGDRAAKAHERLVRVAREAALQCRRARLPAVEPVGTVVGLAGTPGLVVADRAGGPVPEPHPGAGWMVLVGPEGGLAPDELDALGDPPRLAVGPHVLRAATAPIAAAGVLAARRS